MRCALFFLFSLCSCALHSVAWVVPRASDGAQPFLTTTTPQKATRGGNFIAAPLQQQQQQQQHQAEISLSEIPETADPVAPSEKVHTEISPYYRQDRCEHGLLPPVVDPDGVAHLLEQRHQARCDDDYIRASTIDRQLKKLHGVVVYDHPPIWSRSSSKNSSPPAAVSRQQAHKQTAVMQRAFGATGHPYQHVGGSTTIIDPFDCDLNISDIHALLSRYTRCRLTFQQEEADAVYLELSLHGVQVSDASMQWTTDATHDLLSRTTATTAAGRDVKSENLVSRLRRHGSVGTLAVKSYARDARSEAFIGCSHSNQEEESSSPSYSTTSSRIQQRVEQLLLFRSAALHRGEGSLAESLALELHRTYNVGVNDATKTWSVGCQFSNEESSSSWNPPSQSGNEKLHVGGGGGRSNSDSSSVLMFPSTLLFGDEASEFHSVVRYRRSRRSQPVPGHSQQRVNSLVHERIHKREECKFLEADAIRRELWHTYNVGVNDRLQQYSVGGAYDDGCEDPAHLP